MPAISQACSTVMPAGTSISIPSMVSFGMVRSYSAAFVTPACRAPYSRMRRSTSGRKWRIRPWIGHAAASPSAQIVWPSICLVTSSSRSISLDLGPALHHALHHAPHPAGALAARRALAAALVHVELRQARDRLDDVGRLVHDDHRRGAEAGLAPRAAQSKSISTSSQIDFGMHRHRRAARDDRQQIVPAAAHAAGMLLDQLLQRDAHLLLDVAGLVHVAGDAEQLGAGVLRPAERREPGGAAPQDGRRDRDRLDVVDRGRAAVEADRRRERRLQARLALLAFEALEQRRLLAADIGAGAAMQVDVEIVARAAGVLADQAGLVGLVDRVLQMRAPRCRTRRGCRCRPRARPWRSRRAGSLRAACAGRSA